MGPKVGLFSGRPRLSILACREQYGIVMDATMWRQLGFDVPDTLEFARVTIKLVVAAVLGGAMGWERELKGKAAGLRTHMLVAVGAALFVMAPLEAWNFHELFNWTSFNLWASLVLSLG